MFKFLKRIRDMLLAKGIVAEASYWKTVSCRNKGANAKPESNCDWE